MRGHGGGGLEFYFGQSEGIAIILSEIAKNELPWVNVQINDQL